MKTILSILLNLCVIGSFGQINQLFPNLPTDIKGNPKKITEYQHDGCAPNSWKYIYEYAANKLIRQTNKFRNGLFYRKRLVSSFKYDTLPGKTVIKELHEAGSYVGIEEKNIDSENKILSCNIFHSEKENLKATLGVRIKDVQYSADGKITSYEREVILKNNQKFMVEGFHFKYNDIGQLIRIEKVDLHQTFVGYEDSLTQGLFHYKNVSIQEPKLKRSWDIFYNQQNEISKIFIQGFDTSHNDVIHNEPITYSFKYDKNGNWVKRYTKLGDRKQILSESRKIAYENN